jgi:preprotein translocase subunit YajC
MSSSPMFIWVILSVIWIVLFLYVIDRMQKSKRSNESEMEKRIQRLEEENKKLNNEKNDS